MQIDNIPLLRSVKDQINTTPHRYTKNYTLHQKGDACIGIDILLSGSLVAYSLTQNGSESIVFDFAAGSVIGANLLFGTVNKYPMNIYCTTDCSLVHISREEIRELLHNYDFAMGFIKNISQNSQGMHKKIAMYSQKSLRENLLDYLFALSAEQKSKTVTLPISKKQLADYLGVQRPSLFRELKAMKDEGIIEVLNRQMVLL